MCTPKGYESFSDARLETNDTDQIGNRQTGIPLWPLDPDLRSESNATRSNPSRKISIGRSTTFPPTGKTLSNLGRPKEDQRRQGIFYLATGLVMVPSSPWQTPQRALIADSQARKQFQDYQSNPQDLANARVEFIPWFEARKTLATAAPERGGFTNSDEEFPESQGTTHQLHPRTASLWAAQAPGDKIRARVVLLTAIHGGGMSSGFLCPLGYGGGRHWVCDVVGSRRARLRVLCSPNRW